KEFPNAIIQNVNHTVYAPGIYHPPAYAFDLLGFNLDFWGDIVRWNEEKQKEEIAVKHLGKTVKNGFIITEK
ncbi:MAG: hypothetical protein ACFFDW_10615, partial [Candidatus Thorarchaeota archaeon]